LSIIEACLQADSTHYFKTEVGALKKALVEELPSVIQMSAADASTHMAGKKLDFEEVVETITAFYRTEFHTGQWPPATTMKDSKAPPKAYCQEINTLEADFQGMSKTKQAWWPWPFQSVQALWCRRPLGALLSPEQGQVLPAQR
jgi:hypothetical protein